MVVIPNLVETPFQRIVVGFSVPVGESKFWVRELDDDAGPFYACIPGEKTAYAMFAGCEIFSSDDRRIHAALSLSFDEPPEQPREAQHLFDFIPPPPDGWKWEQTDLSSIELVLELFLGKTVDLFVRSSYSVGRAQFPPESLVASMIGLRTKAGEEQFLMSGAQFAVRGFPEDTISWYLEPGSRGQKVAGELVRGCMEEFHSESVSDAVHVLEARFNRIVRAQTSVRAHAAS